MRKLSLILALGTLTIVASLAGPAVRTTYADEHKLSLEDLRGKFAGKSTGFTTVCVNVGGCSAPSPTLLQKNFGAVTEASFDEEGNFCGTAVATSTSVSGSAAPTHAASRVIAGSVTSFDPSTAEGDVGFNIYNGGSCEGAKFNSTGATLTTTGTAQVVVSDGGNRIDGVVKSFIGTAGQFGSVLNKMTLFRQVEDHRGPSLEDLAGNYVGKSIGFTTVCINIGGCSAISPIIVPLNFESDIEGTVDEAGNSCAISTSASSPVAGTPATVFVAHRVETSSIITFDQATGQAEVTFSAYDGGSCNGAVFDNTGATLIATGTSHVVISERGNRVDGIVESYVSAAGRIGSVVNTTTCHRQKREEERQEH